MPARRGERVLPNRRDEVNDVMVTLSTKHTNLMEIRTLFSRILSLSRYTHIHNTYMYNTERERERAREREDDSVLIVMFPSLALSPMPISSLYFQPLWLPSIAQAITDWPSFVFMSGCAPFLCWHVLAIQTVWMHEKISRLRLREKEKEIDRLQEEKEKGGREGGSSIFTAVASYTFQSPLVHSTQLDIWHWVFSCQIFHIRSRLVTMWVWHTYTHFTHECRKMERSPSVLIRHTHVDS